MSLCSPQGRHQSLGQTAGKGRATNRICVVQRSEHVGEAYRPKLSEALAQNPEHESVDESIGMMQIALTFWSYSRRWCSVSARKR